MIANFMVGISDLISNSFLTAAISSWIIAQVLKVVIHAAVNRKLDLKRLLGDGGMPSGHSATVSSIAAMCALECGTKSAEFAISAVLAIIVCHDAMGVRRETGKQNVILNEIIKSFDIFTSQKLPEIKLKEFVGHTPFQVVAGVAIGIINSVIIHGLLS